MVEDKLIAAARLGDQDAFAELYQQNIGYVRAVGRSVLRKNDLDDMCQDTFLMAFTRLQSFEGTSSFRTWLTRIAINQCLQILRAGRRLRNGEAHLMQVDDEMAEDGFLDRCVFSSRDAQLDGLPARLDLEKLLGQLKPEQRRVVEMAYVEDVPNQEIAEALGISDSAVRCTLYRAKRILRDYL